jgi:hypothetical protein
MKTKEFYPPFKPRPIPPSPNQFPFNPRTQTTNRKPHMKTLKTQLTPLALPLLLTTLIHQPAISFAQESAFTYQGHLTESGTPANGVFDYQFRLYAGANPVGLPLGTVLVEDAPASNGLFTVQLDFGANAFNGNPRWVEISVRPGTNAGAYAPLTPLQPVTATPYAIRALNVGANGLAAGAYANAVTLSNPGNSFTGNGAGLTNVSATTLGGLDAAGFWQLGGNGATTPGTHFLGTTDNLALEFKVNNARGLRLEPTAGAPNLIGGSAANTVGAGARGATIAGGHENNLGTNSNYSAIGGGNNNSIVANSSYTSIAGGSGNEIGAGSAYSAIGAGSNNKIASDSSSAVIAGGSSNDVGTNSSHSAIGGGSNNNIADHSPYTTIAGGYINNIGTNSDNSAIGGGMENAIADDSPNGTIAGGRFNDIGTNSDYAVVGGGFDNHIANNSSATIAGGVQNNIGTASSQSTVGGGYNNNIGNSSSYATIAGGYGNDIADNSPYAAIAGGHLNDIGTNSGYSIIGGGYNNNIAINSTFATIPGGRDNVATNHAFAAGRRAKANHTGAFVWADSQSADFASTTDNQFNVRAAGGVRLSDDTPDLSFGSSTRQMIQLYSTTYAVGVQSSCLYLRSNGDVSWFQGGVHSDTRNDPGAGGVEMMRLRTSGLTVNGTFVSASDRNAKENIAAVDPREVLEKVVALPIARWNYRHDQATPHLGPMAQDFHAAFNVGPDERHIATVDADGVALAAIQGLNQKLEQKQTEIAELKQRLEKLEQLMNHKNGGAK